MKNTSFFTSFIFKYIEKVGSQLISVVVTIILARVLDPSIYGIVALVSVITAILQVFVDSGFASALIQKKNADTIDFSSVCLMNSIFCLVIYFMLYHLAPFLELYFRMDNLSQVIRVLGIVLVFSGVRNVQLAYISRHMLFNKLAYASLYAMILSAVLGIYMAYNDYGIWSLVFQTLSNIIISTVILLFILDWRPQFIFSISRIKKLYSFGWKIFVANFLSVVTNQARQFLIGKFYSPDTLAFFNRGWQFPNLIVENINSSIDSVLFPTLANKQDDIADVKRITRKSIQISSFILTPIMIGMFVSSDVFVSIVLTDKWLPCVPYMRIFCIVLLFYPIHTANLNAIKATGRSGMLLQLEITKDCINIIILFITMHFGVLYIALGVLVSSLLSLIINAWPNKEYLKYSYLEQFKDCFLNFFQSILMGIVIVIIGLYIKPSIFCLMVQIVLGLCIYLTFSYFLKNPSFFWLLSLIKKIV